MYENNIALNKFDPRKTKTVLIHDGRFHADDMMFAAMAIVAAEKCRNRIDIIRSSEIPKEYRKDIVVGDMGLGIYDHHTDKNGRKAIGSEKADTEHHLSAACGLLYQDICNVLFPGNSETKLLFEALLDIIEHCDNTPDKNTFSDSVNYLIPHDLSRMDEMADKAFRYCKDVVNGFVSSHEKEIKFKPWAVPKICNGIIPGVEEKRDFRYFKASHQTKVKYGYISFNNTKEIKLKSMDTYSLACGALTQAKRAMWRKNIEENDAEYLKEIERREREEWPNAEKNMIHKTIFLNQYIPYGPYVKDTPALFVVAESQRGGYCVNILKTNTGKYRVDPDLLKDFEGCTFIANDKRFLTFETKEQALKASHTVGMSVEQYLQQGGFDAYREIYGGCLNGYTGDFYQDLISEDIALNLYVKDTIKDLSNLTVMDYRRLQLAVMDNDYLIHSMCSHLEQNEVFFRWNNDIAVTDTLYGTPKKNLLTVMDNGRRWDTGLKSYMDDNRNRDAYREVHPYR